MWQRVRLQGLVRDSHLNGPLGAVEEVGTERDGAVIVGASYARPALSYHFARLGESFFGFVWQ